MAENSDFKIVLYALLALGGLAAFFLSRDRFRDGFLFFIATLGLGYRTVALTPYLKIIPAEIILWILPFIASRQDWIPLGNRKTPRLPRWLWLMLPFWIIAWLPRPENYFPWDVRLAEFRDFALAVPLFIVAPVVLRKPGGWRLVALTFFGTSAWVAAMALFEYVFPGVARALPGFAGNAEPIVTEGFARASFSFYGQPVGACLCLMSVPLVLPMWRWWPTPGRRAATAAGAALLLAALYIAGWRHMWMLLGVQFLLFTAGTKRYALAGLGICLAFMASAILPSAAQDRLLSLETMLEGRPDEVDTSGQKRWSRATDAIHYALQGPMGHGWAGSGWVHNDFLQVAANQGLAAGLLFLGAYGVTLGRLVRRVRRRLPPGAVEIGQALLLSFAAIGGTLLFEGAQVTPQTMLPVWLVWALAETWLAQTSAAREAPRALRRSARRQASAVRFGRNPKILAAIGAD